MLRGLIVAVAMLVAASALAQDRKITKFRWTADRGQSGWVLNGFDWTDGFNEQDTLVRLACKRGKLEIGLGADVGVGKGKGEVVGMSVTSGTTSLRIEGVSKNSPNFEMTSGVELVKSAELTDPLLDLLKLEQPVTLRQEPSGKRVTFPAKGFGAQLAKFMKGCGAG